MRPKPFLMLILDGWGYREDAHDNAIAQANTPVWDKIWQENPHVLISGSGQDVGLPDNQMGNSEVGHMNIGAGRVVYQELTKIDKAIREGRFAENAVLQNCLKNVKQSKKTLHVMGLLSPGGVHSHQAHIQALLVAAQAQGVEKIYLHAFLDGRDVPPQSAAESLQAVQKTLDEIGVGQIATIMGRFYAMDRDARWDRVEKAYQALVHARADHQAQDAYQGLEQAYQQRSETDEFVQPTLTTADYPGIEAGDAVVFMNFRADRARELSRALVDPAFSDFTRAPVALSHFVTLTQYASDIPAEVMFPAENLSLVLGEVFAQQGLTQLRIAETEKYAHVTFFINGGVEAPFAGEDRLLIPSPKVATYDLQPEMSAPELTDQLVEAITHQQYDAIICNYANPDMVGHTGNMAAAIQAVECIDHCLGRITEALKQVNGACLITADHGNVEQMFDHETVQPHTAHTCELVPLVYVGPKAQVQQPQGILSDLAPTMLSLMDLPIPEAMTGKVLLKCE